MRRMGFGLGGLVVVLALCTSFGFAGRASAGLVPPTIASDKADYSPRSTVVLTGSDWQPGETVRGRERRRG